MTGSECCHAHLGSAGPEAASLVLVEEQLSNPLRVPSKNPAAILVQWWFHTAQLFSHFALQDSVRGFHMHCIEDRTLSPKASITLLFKSTGLGPQGRKLAFSLLLDSHFHN